MTTTIASASTAPNFASPSLYVGDLLPEITEALLYDVFSTTGPVASVRVCRDASTRRSLGYAYVNYQRIEDAEKALETLNFKLIRNRPCRIMWSIRDPVLRRNGQGNIFVQGLNKEIDNKQLWDTFSIFGNILSCKVVTNVKGESNGYGFVHFETDESAAQAIEKVNGKMIADCLVSVQPFKSKKDRGIGSQTVFTNIFVKNLAGNITQDAFLSLVSKYGVVTSSVLRADADKDRAFGFVNYAESEHAQAAADDLNNKEVDGRVLFAGRAMKKSERERENRAKFDQYRYERTQKYANLNLFVKNLAETVDDDRLKAEFGKFGTITSAKVARDSDVSRGFGFVCFSTPEEATRAVTELNGRMIDSKPLYVALHQRKETRRAILEQNFASRQRMPASMYGGAPNMGGFGNHMMPMYRMYGGPGLMPAPQQRGGNNQFRGQMRMPMGPNGPMMQMHPMMFPPHVQQMNANLGRGPRQSQLQQQTQQQQQPQQQQNRPPRQTNPNSNYRQSIPANGQPGIKFSDNVRNPRVQQNVAPSAAVEAQVLLPLDPSQPLTANALAQAQPDMQKQMIGERLFPLIKIHQPELAGKITGMLLEMDNLELLHLLESTPALMEKINEAISVLSTSE